MNYALTFDDIQLVPQYSTLLSRSHTVLNTTVAGLELKIPLIASNMDSVCGFDMAWAMSDFGGMGILHRYMAAERVVDTIKALKGLGSNHIAIPSIGVGKEEVQKAEQYIKAGADAICVDIAHGDSKMMYDTVKDLIAFKYDIYIIAGNICTYEAAQRMAESGVNAIKVGVGPGAACSTRIQTGHGVPQLAAIEDVARIKARYSDIAVIADGGMRYPGDIVKALAFGADAVMLGSMLAGTDESPGKIIEENGQKFKIYRGMASAEAQMDFRGKINNDTPEGVSMKIPYKGPLEPVIKEIIGGIRSGLSYSGARTIKELQNNFKYVVVTANGVREAFPHGLLTCDR